MSKKLARAIVEGKVTVYNSSSGQAMVKIPLVEGGERTVIVPPLSKVELAPKYTTAGMLKRSRNLGGLLYSGVLRVQ